jgi:hypothetical protein
MLYFNDETWSAILAHEDTQLEPATTARAIAAFEAKHKFTFPDAHKEFLRRANGGVVGYARLFGVERKDHLDLSSALRDMEPYINGLKEGRVLPFAKDWGGSYFCYGLQQPASSKGYPVIFWNHEYSEEPNDHATLWSTFSPDFVAFVKKVIKGFT